MTCEPEDIGNTPEVAHSLVSGVTFESTLNVDCGDTDFFRIDVVEGHRYSISSRSFGPLADASRVRLLDSRTWTYWDYTDDRPVSYESPFDGFNEATRTTTYTFTARYSGSYYLSVDNSQDPRDGRYEVRYSRSAYGGGRLFRDIESIQNFGEGNDGQEPLKKTFAFSARIGERYALEVVGAAGIDPWIGTRSGENNFYSDGTGNRARIEFTAEGGQGSGLYYATVGANQPGEFRIRLSSVGDDHQMGRLTTSRIKEGHRIVGNAETGSDIDWFRASMVEGEFYRVRLSRHGDTDSLGAPQLLVRNPASELIGISFLPPALKSSFDGNVSQAVDGPEILFQAQTTGDHFLIARSRVPDINGFYQLSYERERAPIIRKYQTEEFETYSIDRFEILDETTIPLSDFFSAPPASTEYQVFSSTVEFLAGSTAKPDGVIHSITPSDLSQWSLSSIDNGTHEIMVRAKSGGKWSQWVKTPVVGKKANPALLSGASWNDSEITYHFSETLPSYFDGVYQGFQAIPVQSDSSSGALRNSLAYKSWGFFDESAPREGDASSPIQVFIADNVDGYYDVFAPGEGAGGDIVLNSAFYDIDDTLQRGTREYVEILRAFGEALGLKTDSSVSRFASVMGGDLNHGPYAIEFMPDDINTLRSMYGTDYRQFYLDPTNEADSGYYFQDRRGLTPNQGSIGDFNTSVDQLVDLRTEKLSFVRTLPEEDRIVSVTGFGNATRAIAGDGNDVIFGNGRDNGLSGLLGSDYLQGFSGDDNLFGGNGNDWYGYRFGDGDDTITEGKSTNGNWPGRDTIRLQGFGPFDLGQIDDSLEFERIGTDLRINLSLDDGAPDGSITIRQQAFGSYSVETLELFQDGVRSSPRISLLSVFSQLADGETKRFQTTNNQDRFGLLVSPI